MKILEKKVLADTAGVRITRMKISSPDIASSARPGQFVVLMADERGERIPLTIVDNPDGAITIIFQEVGFTTKLLGAMKAGESLYALVGPLGRQTDIKKYGRVVVVGGGVGIAEIYPVAKALKKASNHVTTIIGSRSKDLLILENELKDVSDEFHVATDDGSYGRKGFTVDILAESLKNGKYDLVYSVGPIPMMKRTAMATRESGVKTLVSLNSLMVDATGMCGCCRVTVAGKVRFACVDGPEFDAGDVDWEELAKRNRIYEDKEKHICSLIGKI